MHPSESPVANLFGGSLGFTLNKKQSIEKEKASSVRARVAIQEALAVEMSSLHIEDLLSRRVELPDNCRTMIVTPDGDEDDEQRIIDDSADDSDYDDATVANPTHKSLPKNIRNKKSEPKLTLDHNFMCFLRPHTFDHKLFRRGNMLFGFPFKHGRSFAIPEGINNVIDEVMEYEPDVLVPDIDDHVFTNEDDIDDDGIDGEEQEMTMEIGGLMTRPCLMDLVLVGWNKLKEMNVKKLGW